MGGRKGWWVRRPRGNEKVEHFAGAGVPRLQLRNWVVVVGTSIFGRHVVHEPVASRSTVVDREASTRVLRQAQPQVDFVGRGARGSIVVLLLHNEILVADCPNERQSR